MKKTILLGVVAASLGLAATAVRAAEPTENWGHYCASCHGKDGAGHTKAGKLLGVKDLTDAEVQKAFTDDQASTDLKQGLIVDGKTKMKPFGDRLSDDDIKALVVYVRSLKK